MLADLPTSLPLICPACRARSERGWELHTVELVETLVDDGKNEVLEGILACVSPTCGRRYPIIDGIPILLPRLEQFLRTESAAVVERDLAPAVAALLAEPGPDDQPYSQLLEHLSIYLDAHWGDRADPPVDSARPAGADAPSFGFAGFAERLAERADRRVAWAVELGASVGRGVYELARGADRVLGVDLRFGALRRARRLLLGEALPYARRVAGRHYRPALLRAGRPAPTVQLVCGDALDPPLPPGAFQRVAALNLLDTVRRPSALLSVCDGLCARGGELLLASPYAWQSGIVDEDARLGGADPGTSVRDLLTGFTVEEEGSVRWWLRRDARCTVNYDVHFLRGRKR